MSKPLIALIGKSGSGKNYIASKLERKGYVSVKSYTTRSVRLADSNDINTHIFISPDRVSEYKDDIVADTYFNGNYYFATASQLNAADIYILDVVGLKQLYKNYKGKDILAFYIECDSSICSDRMAKRGDSDEAIMSRLQYDAEAFKGAEELCDYVVTNETQEQANDIVDYIEKTMKYYRSRTGND